MTVAGPCKAAFGLGIKCALSRAYASRCPLIADADCLRGSRSSSATSTRNGRLPETLERRRTPILLCWGVSASAPSVKTALKRVLSSDDEDAASWRDTAREFISLLLYSHCTLSIQFCDVLFGSIMSSAHSDPKQLSGQGQKWSGIG